MDEKRALIALSQVKGLSRLAKRRICDAYPDVNRLLHPDTGGRQAPAGIAARFDDWRGIDRDLRLLEKLGARVITIKDREYPELLRHIPDAPIVLYARGSLRSGTMALAVVGSRKASPEGRNLAGKIAGTLSFAGITIVSGLARGIDTAAHTRALEGEGKTAAVLGCGIDVCYPPENEILFEKIAEQGVLLTEYLPGEQPLPYHFPERNRIIAGLARGVLVVEATARSGSLITSRLALEYGREVMAVPGSVLRTEHAGSNRLIKEGAKLIDSVEDILTTCFTDAHLPAQAPMELDSGENKVYSLIGFEKVHADEVIERSGMDTKAVMAALTRLTMKNVVAEISGGYFIRR